MSVRLTASVDHPAKFSDPILDVMGKVVAEYVAPRRRFPRPISVLDPFAGTGKIHTLADHYPDHAPRANLVTLGVELMPKWANMHHDTMVGDATALSESWTGNFDVVVTSPCYGNRMADHHEAKDKCSKCKGAGQLRARSLQGNVTVTCDKCDGSGLSPRKSYRHAYGDGFFTDAPIESNAGVMAWGPAYRELHSAAISEMYRVLRRSGILALNMKNHVRDGRVVRVSTWWARTMRARGFRHLETWSIPLAGMTHGANREARVANEVVYVMKKP